MDHIVLNVTDVMGMVGFYTEVMGFEAERLDAFQEGRVPFPSVRLNPQTIIDLFPRHPSLDPDLTDSFPPFNLNHFCIALEMEEWNDLQVRLQRHGIEIVEGPVQRWGARGNALSMYFKDPQGNTLEARCYEVLLE
ncbi:MAG: VOC family protein [Candidatus Thiodiazotropha sp.]